MVASDGTRVSDDAPDDAPARPAATAHVVNHLTTVLGAAATGYFLWSMVLNPSQGPLPGTLLPLAVGLTGFGVGLSVFAWGAYRTFAVAERERPG